MTNTAIRRSTGALVAAFGVISDAVSIAPVHADPVYDQKFLDYFDAKGVPVQEPQGRARYNLMKDEGWTEKEATTFIQAAAPAYCRNAWG